LGLANLEKSLGGLVARPEETGRAVGLALGKIGLDFLIAIVVS